MLPTTKGVILLLSLSGLLFPLNNIITQLDDAPKNQEKDYSFLETPHVLSNTFAATDLSDKHSSSQDLGLRPKLNCPYDESGFKCGEALPIPYSTIKDFLEKGGSYSEFCEGDFSLSSTELGDPKNLDYCSDILNISRRRYTLTDACGYSKSCIQRFVFDLDSTPPETDCSVISDVFVGCEDFDMEDQVQEWIEETESALLAASTDNCVAITADHDYLSNAKEELSCDEAGGIIVTYHVYDACGQRVSCQASILPRPPKPNVGQPHDKSGFICGASLPEPATTIEEYIALGGNIEEHCGRGLTLSYTDIGDLASMDFCSDRPIIVRRRYTVTDGCGSTRSSIQRFEFARDTEAPSVDCGEMSDFTVDCDKSLLDGEIQDWISSMQNKIMKSATDNCSAMTIEHNYTAGAAADMDCAGSDKMIISFSVSDACGNTSNCEAFIISNLPSEPVQRPDVICVSDIDAVKCDEDLPFAVNTLNEFAAAGGEIINYCEGKISISSEDIGSANSVDICSNTGNIMRRRYIIEDECGNERRCIQRIFFEQDVEAPSVDCDLTNDLIINCDAQVDDEDIHTWLDLVTDELDIASSDNCSGISITNDYIANAVSSLDCADNNNLVVTYIISDECGNASSCSVSILKEETGSDGLVLGNKTSKLNSILLHQNAPNPFEESTMISFELKEAAEVRLTVYDMSGKLLWEHSEEHNEGVNTINVTRDMLKNISGVVFYSLEAHGFKEVKTMIILE